MHYLVRNTVPSNWAMIETVHDALQKVCEFVSPLYSLHATKSQRRVGQPKYEWEIVTCDCLAQRPICFQIPSGDLGAESTHYISWI